MFEASWERGLELPGIVLLAKTNYMDELWVRVGLRKANAHGRPHGHRDGEGLEPLMQFSTHRPMPHTIPSCKGGWTIKVFSWRHWHWNRTSFFPSFILFPLFIFPSPSLPFASHLPSPRSSFCKERKVKMDIEWAANIDNHHSLCCTLTPLVIATGSDILSFLTSAHFASCYWNPNTKPYLLARFPSCCLLHAPLVS